MTMVVSRKQRIFFRYEGERGAFLLLHHGLLGSHEDWYAAGYVEELAREFRVIVPDARGHGRSDKPAGKEHYSLLQMAEDLIEIMNELGVRNSHFVGYGIGALVGFELLRRFPERMRIAILGGESALVTPAVQDVYRAEAESLRAMSLADYLKALTDQGRIVRHAASVDEEQERPAALALLEAICDWPPAPAERIQVASPLTLFTGSEDPAAGRVEAARSGVSRARLVQFPGFGHWRLFEERVPLMEEVLRLLKSGRKDDESRARGEQAQPGGEARRMPHSGGAQGRGGERPRGPSGRRYGRRWTDRTGAGGHPGQGAQAARDAAQPAAALAADAAEEPVLVPVPSPEAESETEATDARAPAERLADAGAAGPEAYPEPADEVSDVPSEGGAEERTGGQDSVSDAEGARPEDAEVPTSGEEDWSAEAAPEDAQRHDRHGAGPGGNEGPNE